MSRQLSIQKFVPNPKRRHTDTEEEEERSNNESQASTSQSESLEADDIASSLQCSPCQPINIQFPVTYFSRKARSFNPDWFRQYSWLEYSVKRDAAYCYPCRLLGNTSAGTSRPEKAFTTAGYRDWKHATGSKGMLVSHNNCISHKQAIIAWEQFKATSTTGSVAEQLGSTRAAQIKKNRHYVKTVAEVLLLCSKQEISFRAHDESSDSLNKGNFKEILALVAKHDPIVGERFFHGPRNAVYTAPKIQNEIINIMASIVRRHICNSIQKSGYYSLLADETKDASKQEQLSIVIRYVDSDTHQIVERFLTFVIAFELNAEHLSKYIMDALALYNLDVGMIVSQGYDGASVMSGCCSGVQTRIRELVPQAVYIHCHAHCLNLVLVDCVKENSYASEFFALVQSLYVFMSHTKAHIIYLEKQSQLHPDHQLRQLQRLSDTRWACRFLALDVLASTFDSILATLECITEGDDKPRAIEATGLLHQVYCFKFISCLIIFMHIMGFTKSLSDALQNEDIDFAFATDLVHSTSDTLKGLRTNETWNHTYKYITHVAALHNIQVQNLRKRRQTRRPQRMDDYVSVESTVSTGQRESLNSSESLKTEIWFPVLDHVLCELDRRFSKNNLELMKSVQACSPSSTSFLEPTELNYLASFYNLSTDLLANECVLAKGALKSKNLSSTTDVYHHIIPLQAAFPTLKKIIQIALTLAVSTAKCERSFSTVKRIKSYLRTSMTEQRLTDIAILSIENDLSDKISLDDVVTEFGGQDKNRTITLF